MATSTEGAALAVADVPPAPAEDRPATRRPRAADPPVVAADAGEAVLEATSSDAVAVPGETGSGDDAGRAAYVFARLRAEQAGADAAEGVTKGPADGAADSPDGADATEGVTDGGDAPDPPPGPAEPAGGEDEAARPFLARASALESVEKDLARRLKRVLADEQNEVLDLLRRGKPAGADDLLPDPVAHGARWAEAAKEPLTDAVEAGADWSGGKSSPAEDLAEDLGRTLTAPLRERIARSFTAADGNLDEVADRVRALYREWKGSRLTGSLADAAAAAYARGVLDGVPAGAEVRWVIDPAAGPCPDCDDNVLAGAIVKGELFPTGHASAPAHPGCHCLVLPAGA